MGKEEPMQQAIQECDTQEITVPLGYGNLLPVRMTVHTPKNMKGKNGLIPLFSLF